MITFPGYKTIFENMTYTKEIDSNQRGILIPRKFIEPTKEEIILFLKFKGQKILNQEEPSDNIEKIISKLPLSITRGLLQNQGPVYNFLIQNMPSFIRNITDQLKTYVHLMYGKLPEEQVMLNQIEGNITNPTWYEEALFSEYALERNLGIGFQIRLLTNSDGSLTSKEKVINQIKKGTKISEQAELQNNNYSTQEIEYILTDFYTGLKEKEKIKFLKDNSEIAIYEAATFLTEGLELTINHYFKK